MSKEDLPSFIVEASCDISRWRFDVNAHVSTINDNSIVFSHEQGADFFVDLRNDTCRTFAQLPRWVHQNRGVRLRVC